jgi:hypothetical protein
MLPPRLIVQPDGCWSQAPQNSQFTNKQLAQVMFVLTQLQDTVLVQASELYKGEIIVFRIEQHAATVTYRSALQIMIDSNLLTYYIIR